MSNSSTKTVSTLVLFIAGLLLCNPFIANAFKINLQLTGDVNFPGILKVNAGMDKKFDRLCFLGQDALGMIDLSFLETLAENGIPEGDYQIAHAFPDERWPVRSFSPNGALRFSPLPELQPAVFKNLSLIHI